MADSGPGPRRSRPSKVRIEIDVDRIPRVEGVSSLEAANSAKKYEIVATAPAIDTEAFVANSGLPSLKSAVVWLPDLRESSYSGAGKKSLLRPASSFRDK